MSEKTKEITMDEELAIGSKAMAEVYAHIKRMGASSIEDEYIKVTLKEDKPEPDTVAYHPV